MRAVNFLCEKDGVGNFPHRFTAFTALLLKHLIGFVVANAQIALEDSGCVPDELARAKKLGKFQAFVVAADGIDFRADQKADGRDQLNFALAVVVRLAVLDIDDADQLVAAEDRDRKKGLVSVFRELVEGLKARVLSAKSTRGVAPELLGGVVRSTLKN